jgi:hypothetical protein
VKVWRKPRHDDRNTVDIHDLDYRAALLRPQRVDAPEESPVLVRRRDVEAMYEDRSMTLDFLSEEAPRASFRDRFEELVLGDEFCACHRTQPTHTLGTAKRRRTGTI